MAFEKETHKNAFSSIKNIPNGNNDYRHRERCEMRNNIAFTDEVNERENGYGLNGSQSVMDEHEKKSATKTRATSLGTTCSHL